MPNSVPDFLAQFQFLCSFPNSCCSVKDSLLSSGFLLLNSKFPCSDSDSLAQFRITPLCFWFYRLQLNFLTHTCHIRISLTQFRFQYRTCSLSSGFPRSFPMFLFISGIQFQWSRFSPHCRILFAQFKISSFSSRFARSVPDCPTLFLILSPNAELFFSQPDFSHSVPNSAPDFFI